MALRERLLAWYATHRRDLPWRHTRDAYALVIAEMMLQQTGVDRVAPKWVAFLARFPTWSDLARATAGDVIREWRGLGYNRRAVNLHRLAQAIVDRFGGTVPDDPKLLRSLPGIGPYTVAAILSFVHGRDVVALDVNVRRVVGRAVFGCHDAPPADVERAAAEALPRGRGADWNQALMDFASIQCTLRRPACLLCPMRDACAFAGQSGASERPTRLAAERAAPYVGSSRYWRGRIVDAARGAPDGIVEPASVATIVADGADPVELLAGLVRDGLLVQDGARYRLP